MNILISVNKSYYEAARILLRSLFYNNKNYEINIYLFHSELDHKRIAKLNSFIKKNGGKIYVKKINDTVMKNVPVGLLSKETYYRLMAPDLLPSNLDRILYLDIDMIVIGDISKLYELDFENNLFIAAPDTSLGIDEVKKNLRMKKESVYINAGVLLLNLKLLRKEFNLEEALQYAKKYPERVPNCDQDVINVLYNQRIGHFEGIFNYEARFHSIYDFLIYLLKHNKIKKEIKIIHYMGAGKPWKNEFSGKFLREYYKYSRNTEYQNVIEENMRMRLYNMVRYISKIIIANTKKIGI